MAVPVIDVVNFNKSKISDESNMDVSTATFKCTNTTLERFEVRAVKSGNEIGRGKGLLVELDNALYPSETLTCGEDVTPNDYKLLINTNQTITIDDEELSQGDGGYTISIYAQSSGGEWNE
jgi:hypothetical protein